MSFHVRNGKIADLKDVLRLIQELADYEKASDEVELTINQLTNDYLSAEIPFGFFVAEKNNQIIGLALYYERYSTWKGRYMYLEDLIVTEKERGKNVGKLLFEKLALLTLEKGMKKMQWQVLDWNQPAINFYDKYNSHYENEWVDCALYKSELSNIKSNKKENL